MARNQHCFWCGDDLGYLADRSEDLPTCGKSECERQARDEVRARDEAEKCAREDYMRYR